MRGYVADSMMPCRRFTEAPGNFAWLSAALGELAVCTSSTGRRPQRYAEAGCGAWPGPVVLETLDISRLSSRHLSCHHESNEARDRRTDQQERGRSNMEQAGPGPRQTSIFNREGIIRFSAVHVDSVSCSRWFGTRKVCER